MGEKVAYERKSIRLNEHDVLSAISYSQSKHILSKLAEWRDTKTVGLTLRITPKKAIWYVRRREITLRLGLASEISLDAARYFAEQVHLAAGRKRDLREFAETLIRLETDKTRYNDRRGNVEIADQFADEASMFAYRKRIGDTGITWTWKVLAQKFLE